METNQLMNVNIGGYILQIEHKTYMGNLNQLWEIGNNIRAGKALPPKRLDDWLRSPGLQEYVTVLERNLGYISQDPETLDPSEYKTTDSCDLEYGESPYYKTSTKSKTKKHGTVPTIKSPLIKTKRGKNGGTWAHLYILIDAAVYLDAEFKYLVYDTFVRGRILELRDICGDGFKDINKHLQEAFNIPSTDYYQYVAYAIAIAEIVFGNYDKTINQWNSADKDQLQMRTKLFDETKVMLKYCIANSVHDLVTKLKMNAIK